MKKVAATHDDSVPAGKNDDGAAGDPAMVREIIKQLRVVTAAARQHFHAAEIEGGLSGAQLWMLAAIAENPGISVSRLSETLSVHISTASARLDKLAKAGMVERRRGQEDRRVVNLRLSQTGRDALARAPRPRSGVVPQALERMPEPRLAGLHADLALLIRSMHEADPEATRQSLPTPVI